MSETETKTAPDYLRDARLRAGYANRGIAAMNVPYSQETIGRHERGEVPMEPRDAIIYAQAYKAPEILYHFCAGCPIGQKTNRSATCRPLPFAVLRVRRMIGAAQGVADRLEEIAYDGEVDEGERKDFGAALSFFGRLGQTIEDFLLLGEMQKAGPVGAQEPAFEEITYRQYTTGRGPCQGGNNQWKTPR